MSGIIRVQKRRDSKKYAVIYNDGPQDERLSFQAKGLWIYLMTKPDNWQVRVPDLVAAGPDGLRVVRSALKELEGAGYLTRVQKRSAAGHFEWETVVYECPQNTPKTEQKKAAPSIQNVPMAIDTFCADTKCADTKRADILSTEVPSTELLNKECVSTNNVPPRAEPTAAPTNRPTRAQAEPIEKQTFTTAKPPQPVTVRSEPLVDMSNPSDPRFTTPFYPAVARACGIREKPMDVGVPMRSRIANAAAKFERGGYTLEQIATMAENWTMPNPPSPDQLWERADTLLTSRKTNGTNRQQSERISEREQRFNERQAIRQQYHDTFGPKVAGGVG